MDSFLEVEWMRNEWKKEVRQWSLREREGLYCSKTSSPRKVTHVNCPDLKPLSVSLLGAKKWKRTPNDNTNSLINEDDNNTVAA